MLRTLLFAALLLAGAQARLGLPRYELDAPEHEPINEEPLILTDLDPQSARSASLVKGAGLDVLSDNYAGFFRTDDKTNATMFFWYFTPSAPVADPDSAPLIIWLQGGPGGSSLFGLFAEMGPYEIILNGSTYEAVPRQTPWSDTYSMLFIENPVGAGFSFVSGDNYCDDTKECVSRNLYSLLTQFYSVFPEKLKAPLYITGESYAGHYVPGFAFYIHEKNQEIAQSAAAAPSPPHVPLAGIAIGDGWVDPEHMIPAYPEMMFNTGLIGVSEKAEIHEICQQSVQLIRNGKNLEAFNAWDKFLNGDVWPYPNLFHNMSGVADYDNYMNAVSPPSFGYYVSFLARPDVRRALHVGDVPFPTNPRACEMHLLEDFMRSFIGELGVLSDHYKVLMYSGQLDVIVGAPLTESFLPHMKWRNADELKTAARKVWRVKPEDADIAGYVRQANNGRFTHAIIRAAGHVAVADQPIRSRDMIERFIKDLPYENLPDPRRH